MTEPLFRDPVHDGASDPTVLRDRATGELVMFYTQRRPDDPGPGVSWIHGSRIGVARSADGRTWRYDGVVDGLDSADAPGLNTHWAPEVFWSGSDYRMYLTFIEGVPDSWDAPRVIREYRSDDLREWRHVGVLPFGDRVIDAAVARCPDGRWRCWVKDEARNSTTWGFASDDLESWRPEGLVIGGRPHEGPNVFELGGAWWLLVDEWRGMGVYRSPDAVRWERQGGPDDVLLGDHPVGRHGDVLVEDGRATLYYFDHPEWAGEEVEDAPGADARRTVIRSIELKLNGTRLECAGGDTPARNAG
ncbi:glycoside hydrolase family protein [Herbiconiux sp. SYSU D00978]|uniref:hypothetical protein n=1 Tax=Herbiconiux sp. SYSU D00978 TaxID=2812562 RepID=UPI001A978A3D|nr:hypothetical protein [Herbiconiux sp. SYSU D00978]